MTTALGVEVRQSHRTSSLLRWLRPLLLVVTLCAGAAQAAVYRGVWDPLYGAPFTNLGWRGTAEYYVPEGCISSGTEVVNNASGCDGQAQVTSAQVEFYDTTDAGQETIATLIFDPNSLMISALSFGLLSTIQRRGVTPLVTLRNFSGATA